MKVTFAIGLLFAFFTVGLIAGQTRRAAADQGTVAAEPLPSFRPQADAMAHKCSFDSDCSHGKCKSGNCGGCSFDSDCKGWGKCKDGSCGGCSFSSDCQGFGDCSSGHCAKSPY